MTKHHRTHHQRYMNKRHPTSPVAMNIGANTQLKFAGVQKAAALSVQQQSALAQKMDLLAGYLGVNGNVCDTVVEEDALIAGKRGPIDSTTEVDRFSDANPRLTAIKPRHNPNVAQREPRNGFRR